MCYRFVLGTIRLSTGKDTTAEDIDAAAAEIVRCVKKLSSKSDDATNNFQGIHAHQGSNRSNNQLNFQILLLMPFG